MTSSIFLSQKAPPCVETRRLSHKARKLVQRFARTRAREKRTGHDKTGQSKRRYVLPTCGEAPIKRFAPKFPVVVFDVITCARFLTELFRGYRFTGGRIFDFPVDSCMCLTTAQSTMLTIRSRNTQTSKMRWKRFAYRYSWLSGSLGPGADR